MVHVCLVLVLASAQADLKQIRKEMLDARKACGSDAACQQKALQDGMARMEAAASGVQAERDDKRASAHAAADAERDRHGGRSGGADGQYIGLPDWAAVEAAMQDKKHCLHKVWPQRLSTSPPVPLRTRPPQCKQIKVHELGRRYCALNRMAVAWQMMHYWRDRYWDDADVAAVHENACFGFVAAAFRISDDDGFRLAVLDFVGDMKTAGSEDVEPFVEKALKSEPPGRVRQRLEWLR